MPYLNFFEIFTGGRSRQCKKCLPASNYFLSIVLPGSTNYVLMKPSDIRKNIFPFRHVIILHNMANGVTYVLFLDIKH